MNFPPGICYNMVMKRYLFTGMLFCLAQTVSAQADHSDSSHKYVRLNEVVISANRFSVFKKHVAQKIDVISPEYIASVNAQNTGDLLMSTGNVYVQKSQQGGSSPVIRGFEASRVLLVVDGVRLNNAIYRAGHLQNVITIDQNMLESVEIMHGPSSTLYGSDALGGVINFRTKAAQLAPEGKKVTSSASGFSRFSSANREKTGHANLNVGFRKWAFLTTFTYSDFDDLKMGSKHSRRFPDYGKRYVFVDQVNGSDSILKNSNPNIQRTSGYSQWDLSGKLLFRENEKITHQLNVQFSGSSDIPRYDRLQDLRNGSLRYAKWYYGPQVRNMATYAFNAEKLTGFFNHVRATLNYQHIEESRHTREYRRYDRLDSRLENLNVYGLVMEGRKVWKENDLILGIDGQVNDLRSTAKRSNIQSGVESKLDTRYPDGENNMSNLAAFAQHTLKMLQGKLVLNEGLRLQGSSLFSTIVDTAVQLSLPYNRIRQKSLALTGNAGLVYHANKGFRMSSVFSSGFRAPNIDDLSRIFESNSGLARLVVPNPAIKPEYTINLDLSISKIFNEKLKLEVTGFYTWFRNAIVLAPFKFKGEDSILYQGVKSQVLANTNSRQALLYGFNAAISADITGNLSASTTINYTIGRFKTEPLAPGLVYERQPDKSYLLVNKSVSQKPMDHIPPLFGKTSLLFHQEKFNIDFSMLYNGAKKLEAYNAEGEDNPQYATAEGSLGWITYNVRAAFTVTRHLSLQAALENIADKHYRPFASGLSAAGRNLVLTIRATL